MNESASWFFDKPALSAVLPFIAGLLLAHGLKLPIFLPFFIFFLFLLFFTLFYKSVLAQIALLLMLFLSGYIYQLWHAGDSPKNHIREYADLPLDVAIEGIVNGPVETGESGLKTVLQTDSVWVLNQVYHVQGMCLLQLYESDKEVQYGDRLVARGQLRLPAGERNPGEFNYQKYLAAQNIHVMMRVFSANQILVLNAGEGCVVFRTIIYPVRQFVISIIDASLSGRPAALLKALLIGARYDIDDDLRQGFANVGVIHVLAVSGLHVGFVLAGLLGLAGFFRMPNSWRLLFVMACLVFYALLTGLKPSVFRATIMAILYLSGKLLQRRTHLLNTLAIAAFVLLCVSPLELFEPGFQLSFVAVLGIFFIYERLSVLLQPMLNTIREKGWAMLFWMVNLFLVSLAAQIATLPLTVYYFNRISLIAVLANLIVIPVIAIIVALGMIAVIISLFSVSLGAVYFNTAWLLLHGLILFVGHVQHIPMAWFMIRRPSVPMILLYCSGLFLFVLWPNIKARKFFVFMICILMNVYIWTRMGRSDALKVTFFDVGQGDAALFQFPNGKTMLVDAGDRTDHMDYGERVIHPYLVRNGIKRIDFFVLTHAHSDHVGGSFFLLNEFKIGCLVKTASHAGSELDRAVEACAAENAVPIRYVQAGDTLLIDSNVLLLILHPPAHVIEHPGDIWDMNNCSIVFKCIYFDKSILMTGDAEKPAELSMLRYDTLLRSSLIKIGHHGSDTAGGAVFRRKIAADYGIVSVAQFNRFGLPSEPLMDAYEKDGTQILRTSFCGAVQFVLYPEKLVKIKDGT